MLCYTLQSYAATMEDRLSGGALPALRGGWREPKGGLLKGGLHFYDFSQNDL